MYCRQCGYKNHELSTFCRRCGSDLRSNSAVNDDAIRSADEPGGLRYASRRRPVWKEIFNWLKSTAGKLSSIRIDPRRLLIIGGGCVAGLVIISVIILAATSSCQRGRAGSFGNTEGNVAGGGHVAADMSGVYFSRLFGDNPGLYRADQNGQNEYKISYRKLVQIGLSGGWIYGVDVDDGQYYRVNRDGTKTQQVLPDDVTPKYAAVADKHVYYIDRGDQKIYRADLSDVSDDKTAAPKKLYDHAADCLNVTPDALYFLRINPGQPSLSPQNQDASASDEDPGGEPQPTSLAEPDDQPADEPLQDVSDGSRDTIIDGELVGRAAMGRPPVFGAVVRLNLNGHGEKAMGVDEAAYLTAASGALFYGVPAAIWVSASDLGGEENQDSGQDASTSDEKPINVQVPALSFQMMQLSTGGVNELAGPGLIDSIVCVTTTKLYCVNRDGHLCRMSFDGSGFSQFPFAGEAVSHPCASDDMVYYFAGNGSLFCRVNSNGLGYEALCARD